MKAKANCQLVRRWLDRNQKEVCSNLSFPALSRKTNYLIIHNQINKINWRKWNVNCRIFKLKKLKIKIKFTNMKRIF